MGRSRYKLLHGDTCPYFVTATTVNWIPLFTNPDIAAILIDSLRFLTESQRIILYAYVIMENHLHLIASSEDLTGEIAKFKSFTARKCIDHYLEHKNSFVLDQLTQNKLRHKRDRAYQFWQEGSHPQRLENLEMMRQKVEYIHANPVRRGYVDIPEVWRYSSARNYAGVDALLPVSLDW